jgi:uncharacterized membrane protein YfcA
MSERSVPTILLVGIVVGGFGSFLTSGKLQTALLGIWIICLLLAVVSMWLESREQKDEGRQP